MDLFLNLSINFPYIRRDIRYPLTFTPWTRREKVAMVSRASIFVIVCVGFINIQSIVPQALALKGTTDVDEFMVEDKRTRMKQNYMVERERALENDGDFRPEYALDPRPDGLPEYIVDYANMIRDDIFLLDNSVETRTRKSGNIKVKKHDQVVPEVPCYCEHKSERVDLSKTRGMVYPHMILNITCDESTCRSPFKCTESIYNVPILKRRSRSVTDQYQIEQLKKLYGMPAELIPKWIPETIPITTGCLCTLAYPN